MRTRLLLPLLAASLLVAVAVASVSYWLGSQRAKQEIVKQTEGVKSVLHSATFPLTDNVLRSIASLTRMDVAVYSAQDALLASTFDTRQLDPPLQTLVRNPRSADGIVVTSNSRPSIAFVVDRMVARTNQSNSEKVLILVDQADVRSARWQATLLPLVTGLSTTLLLATLTLVFTGRLIFRLSRLQSNVQRVAAGDFAAKVSDDIPDEVGNLGAAVDSMAAQLAALWQAVNRRQSERLLHQLSAGMAHQVRNSLTGARMAIELHARNCPERGDDSLAVVNATLDDLDDAIGRLVLVGRGQIGQDHPGSVDQSLRSVQSRIKPIADHHHVKVTWSLADELSDFNVRDRHTFEAAITNLTMNALEAGSEVQIRAELEMDAQREMGLFSVLKVTICDNGRGVSSEISDLLFEPFVTTKPEGMGIGLAHVKRAAEHLGGQVLWRRDRENTIFEMTVQITK